MNILEKANEFYRDYAKVDPWEDAIFAKIKRMQNDTRGQFGEKIVSEALHLNENFVFDMDCTNSNKHADGHYDLKVNGVRIEVKTSCHTSGGTWQHEPLYAEDVCDLTIFIDFSYDFFHISVIPSKDLPLGRDSQYFINKKGHLRKNKDDGYKLDFSQKTIRDLTAFGLTQTFNADATTQDIANFIGGKLNEFV